ncbi:MAG: aminotransferase class IV [Pseudomonadota bacterium]
MAYGAHSYVDDARNAAVQIDINGTLVDRSQATISVFDSGFMLGDGVWEGLRLMDGGVPYLWEHLERLYGGARALDFEMNVTPSELRDRLFTCFAANAMTDGVHARLMVTRGIKSTPYQDPRVTVTPPTIVIIPEHKASVAKPGGLALFTSAFRRTGPDQQDQKLNSHSKLNCIQACIQAAKAGADEALMLDPNGFVATCNSTHFFIVRGGVLWTSSGDYCLGGITRSNVLKVARAQGLEVRERNFSLVDVYSADEAFVTGTFAGLTPVRTVDGRVLGPVLSSAPGPIPGPVTEQLRAAYRADALAARCFADTPVPGAPAA